MLNKKRQRGKNLIMTCFAAVPLTVATLGFWTISELREIRVTSTIINCLPDLPSLCSSNSWVYVRQVTSQYSKAWRDVEDVHLLFGCVCVWRTCFYFHGRRNGPFFSYINPVISGPTENLDGFSYRPNVTQGKPVWEIPMLKMWMSACQGFGATW